MKCDERRPRCLMCHLSKVSCAGYDKSLVFASEDNTTTGAVRFRRPFLDDEERARMCDWLTTSVPPHLALWHITGIDDACEASAAPELQVCRGPFGAFRLVGSLTPELMHTTVTTMPDTSSEEVESHEPASDEPCGPADTAFEGTGDHPILPAEYTEHGEKPTLVEPSTSCWEPAINHNGQIQAMFNDAALLELELLPIESMCLPDCSPIDPMIGPNSNPPPRPGPSSIPPGIRTIVPLPEDAVYLLKHYSTTVLALFTPFKHSKTPWHILFLPHAKSTLAGLTLRENLDHASLCAFYGILTISAASLSGVSGSQRWLTKAIEYEALAQEHSRLMLYSAYTLPKAAKYKTTLIALLTMLQISLVSCNPERTEFFFLEAERFIRLKGLNRRKSRKVRLLHHCYAFERVLYESTVRDGTTSRHRLEVRMAVESSGAASFSQDSLSFRLGSWNDLDQEMLKVKGREEGENDLHLEIPGLWAATLYPEIFGIPEAWLLLLSLVIRLVREKELAERDCPDAISLGEFLRRARAVEQCINNLNLLPTWSSLAGRQTDEAATTRGLLDILVDAMQQALAIFFYRRVYEVDSSLVQEKVLTIRNLLLRVESTDIGLGQSYCRLLWPAYIAAGEAEDAAVRVSFSNWFKNSARHSGLGLFMRKLEDIERLWMTRSRTMQPGPSRNDMMGSSNFVCA